MINNFTRFLSESVDSNNKIESFFKEINNIGYSNTLISSEFIVLDDIALEFKLYEDIVYIISMRAYDIRKEKITHAFQNVVEIADNNSLKIGINPFIFTELNLNKSELHDMYKQNGFNLVEDKWIKHPF